jgi:hypothetical protein
MELELFQLRAGSGCRCGSKQQSRRGQYESNGHDKGSIAGVAAGHCASRQSAHVVTAILGNIWRGRRLLVVMLGNRTVVSGTASHPASGPGSSGKGSVQEYNREQAKTSGDNWPAIWERGAQGARLLLPDTTSKYSTVHGIC